MPLQLHKSVRLLSHKPGATEEQMSRLIARYPMLPDAFIALFLEATVLEISYQETYLRLYGPGLCEQMDDAYGISEQIPGAITVGDNGGGEAIVVVTTRSPQCLFRVGYGALSPEELKFIAPSLESLLYEAIVAPSNVGPCKATE